MEFDSVMKIGLPSGDAVDLFLGETKLWPPMRVFVEKGQLIKIDLNGDVTKETYRVIKVNGTIAEILAMANASSSKFGSNQTYAGSTLDNYLNNTWYNTLSATAKSAIVNKTFRQDSWHWNNSGNPVYSGYYGSSNPGTTAYTISLGNASFGAEITRHVYALSVQDVLDYILDTNITDGKLQNYNIWKMFWNRTSNISEQPWLRSADAPTPSDAFHVYGGTGHVGSDGVTDSRVSRPALTIDLSKIEYEIVE